MKKKRLILGSVLLLIGLVIGLTLSARLNVSNDANGQTIKPLTKDEISSFEGFRMEDAVIKVANTAGKAVVSISTEQVRKIGGPGQRGYYFEFPFGDRGNTPFGQDDPFRRFFDDFLGEMPEREYRQTGLGSGVIIDRAGYILTNEHVVAEADKITVTLPDGREFKGEVKGKDSRSDLAVIKIDAHDLPAASLGDSDNVKIGQWVVAIGNPFGFALQNPEPTVTVGVISALHRALGRVSGERDYADLIQTDAAINPGNSGGPLVDLKGEIIGINVAIFSTSGGYQGIGFAIPVNSAKRIISRLIEGKEILYGWLGITVQNLNEDLAKIFGLPDNKGALVTKVLQDSPAQKAGIKESDIILRFENQDIVNVKELLSSVAKAEVGRKVKVVVFRDKKQLTLEVGIGKRPQNLEEQLSAAESVQNWRGIEVEDLVSGKARHFRFKTEEKSGVLVVNVEPRSRAEEAGIKPGDVILEINRTAIRNLADFQAVTKNLKQDALVKTSQGYFVVKE